MDIEFRWATRLSLVGLVRALLLLRYSYLTAMSGNHCITNITVMYVGMVPSLICPRQEVPTKMRVLSWFCVRYVIALSYIKSQLFLPIIS